MKAIALTVLVAVLIGCSSGTPTESDTQPTSLAPLPIPRSLPAYEHIPASGQLVVLLATNIQDTLYSGLMKGIPTELIGAGFSLLSMDLPCHGPGEETAIALTCWRTRMESGDTEIFRQFCGQLSAVLDELDATDASVVGLSRGGYVATTCAAYDRRIRNIALIMPVTDLRTLIEFDGYTIEQSKFGLQQYVRFLTDRNVLVRIGTNDTRVGTDAAVDFAHAVGAQLDLVEQAGHDLPNGGETAAWLIAQQ